MIEIGSGRWENARREVIERWRQILERIDARDERGVVGLVSARDQFCDEAVADMNEGFSRLEDGSPAIASTPARGTAAGTHCYFCKGFIENGGCLGALDDMELAVYEKRWEDARSLAREYIAKLESLELGTA